MPLYDVEYVCAISEETMATLAQAITECHAHRFATPKFFINVRFTDASGQVVFRGGKPQKYNRIILRTRASNQRSTDLYNKHCRDIIRIWDEVVRDGKDTALRTVWVMGALTTAVEAGIERPKVGEELQWLKHHREEFRRRADDGEEEMQVLMHELATRPEFASVNDAAE